MNDKIRNHVNVIFAAAPKTAKAAEMKEELLTNLNDKYEDLLKSGYDSTAAFHIALSGIGDIDELFQACSDTNVPSLPRESLSHENGTNRNATLSKRSGMMPLLIALAVILIVIMNSSGLTAHLGIQRFGPPQRFGPIPITNGFALIFAVGIGLIAYFIAKSAQNRNTLGSGVTPLLIALAVGLIIVSPGFLVLCNQWGLAEFGVVMMFASVAFGIGLFVYLIARSVQGGNTFAIPDEQTVLSYDVSYHQAEITNKRIIAGIFAILLGMFGIHKFYLGFVGTGLIMFLMNLTVILIPVTVTIGLIEGVIYLSKSDREFFRDYIVHKRAWF